MVLYLCAASIDYNMAKGFTTTHTIRWTMLLSFLIFHNNKKTKRRSRNSLHDRKNMKFFIFCQFLILYVITDPVSHPNFAWKVNSKKNSALQSFLLYFCYECIGSAIKKKFELFEEKKFGETNFEQILQLWIQNNWSFHNTIMYYIFPSWLHMPMLYPSNSFLHKTSSKRTVDIILLVIIYIRFNPLSNI